MFLDLFHRHYWGTPRRSKNGDYIVCYECGKRRKVKISLTDNRDNIIKKIAVDQHQLNS